MSKSRVDIVARITTEIEEVVTGAGYPGEGILSALGYDRGSLFIELPKAKQRETLNTKVDWTGLTDAEKERVMDRVLKDVREKVPEEIYPGTWFDGILISVGRDARVFDLETVRKQIGTPGRAMNLDERVCSPERVKERQAALGYPRPEPSPQAYQRSERSLENMQRQAAERVKDAGESESKGNGLGK